MVSIFHGHVLHSISNAILVSCALEIREINNGRDFSLEEGIALFFLNIHPSGPSYFSDLLISTHKHTQAPTVVRKTFRECAFFCHSFYLEFSRISQDWVLFPFLSQNTLRTTCSCFPYVHMLWYVCHKDTCKHIISCMLLKVIVVSNIYNYPVQF